MTVVSSKEFATHQEKYFDLAVKEEVLIERDGNVFHLVCNPVEKDKERAYYAPDDDFYRSLSADEFRERLRVVLGKVDKKYADKCK